MWIESGSRFVGLGTQVLFAILRSFPWLVHRQTLCRGRPAPLLRRLGLRTIGSGEVDQQPGAGHIALDGFADKRLRDFLALLGYEFFDGSSQLLSTVAGFAARFFAFRLVLL